MKIIFGSYTKQLALLEWQGGEYQIQLLPSAASPSWLAYSQDFKLLFAVEEDSECGKLHSYRFDPAVGNQLDLLCSVETGGKYPCHILQIPERQELWITNYMGGPVSVFGYTRDGIFELRRTIPHHFSGNVAARQGANPQRQEMSHPHSCILAADRQGVYCADLGCDQVIYHPLGRAAQTGRSLAIGKELPSGYGPRHMCLSPDGKVLFVICELEPYLLSFQIGPEGKLEQLAKCPITRQNQLSQASELCLHPVLPYLYVANRNAGYVAQIQNGENGQMELKDEFALASRNPRHIAISPDGQYLFAALQDSHQVEVFSIDSSNGSLHSFQNYCIPFASPAFIGFIGCT